MHEVIGTGTDNSGNNAKEDGRDGIIEVYLNAF